MKSWNKYTIETTTAAVELVSYTLGELGIEGIQVEDKIPLTQAEKEKMFIDILPDLGEDDGVALVSFYMDELQSAELTVAHILDEIQTLRDFVDLGTLTVTQSTTADEDWINNWKAFWKPFKVDDHIIIKPTWEQLDVQEDNVLVVEMDPGTSFGTGTHHTTRLCITQVKEYLKPGDALLDVGCGSGILSIIGLMLGAGRAVATDIDEAAVQAAKENAAVNGLTLDNYKILQGDIITDANFRKEVGVHRFDIVAANILADVIVPLSAVIAQNMKPGGLFISSGIIDTKEAVVKEALINNRFEIINTVYSGEWVSFTARYPSE